MSLMDVLAGLGNVVDLPASMLRDALSLENPVDQLFNSWGSSEDRTSGAEMLDVWGELLGLRRMDEGPVRSTMGMGAEMLLDPLNLAALGIHKLAKPVAQRLGPRYKGGLETLRDAVGSRDQSGEAWYANVDGFLDRIKSHPRILSEVPPGSEYLGTGVESKAFLTPAGDVLRIRDSARQPDIKFVPQQPPGESFLQPTRSVHSRLPDANKRSVRSERLPFITIAAERQKQLLREHLAANSQNASMEARRRIMDIENELNALDRIPDSLFKSAAKEGYLWEDKHKGNWGFTKEGEPIILDPGQTRAIFRKAGSPRSPQDTVVVHPGSLSDSSSLPSSLPSSLDSSSLPSSPLSLSQRPITPTPTSSPPLSSPPLSSYPLPPRQRPITPSDVSPVTTPTSRPTLQSPPTSSGASGPPQGLWMIVGKEHGIAQPSNAWALMAAESQEEAIGRAANLFGVDPDNIAALWYPDTRWKPPPGQTNVEFQRRVRRAKRGAMREMDLGGSGLHPIERMLKSQQIPEDRLGLAAHLLKDFMPQHMDQDIDDLLYNRLKEIRPPSPPSPLDFDERDLEAVGEIFRTPPPSEPRLLPASVVQEIPWGDDLEDLHKLNQQKLIPEAVDLRNLPEPNPALNVSESTEEILGRISEILGYTEWVRRRSSDPKAKALVPITSMLLAKEVARLTKKLEELE